MTTSLPTSEYCSRYSIVPPVMPAAACRFAVGVVKRGAGTVAAMGCAALAVTGVGAVACGIGVIAAGVIGSEAGKRAAGWVYDHALAPAGKAISNGAVGAAKKVAEGSKNLAEGAGKVASALNPFD